MLTTFAGIGQATIISSMTLRKNHVEYETVKRLDEQASGCFSCAHYITGEGCQNCPNRIYQNDVVKKYVNEKNRFGERQPLKKHALLLLIGLHFLNPDSNGYIRRVDLVEMADILGCTVRTVSNNLALLSERNYIFVSDSNIPGCRQVFITEYTEYFKKAQQGGRGFVRLTSSLFEKLTLLPDVNAVRLALRTYIENSEFESKHKSASEKSLQEVKSVLPEYVTKKTLLSTVKDKVFSTLFDVRSSGRSLLMTTKEAFSQQQTSSLVRSECRTEVAALAEEINKENRKNASGRKNNYRLMLTEQDLNDISGIALRYPIPAILQSVRRFYDTYVKENLAVSSIGAVIRTYTDELVSLNSLPSIA